MTYNKLAWEDFVADHPNRFQVIDNGDGTVTIVDAPGNVHSEGTPVDAANLNRIENGIEALYDRCNAFKNGADTQITLSTERPETGDMAVGDLWFVYDPDY